jgi:ribose transport system permease protein
VKPTITVPDIQSEAKEGRDLVGIIWQQYGTLLIFIALCTVISLIQPRFLSHANLMNVARQVSIVAIMATGMTLVIIGGGIDLSVSTVASLAGCVAADLMVRGLPVIPSILVGLSIGALMGMINGLAVTWGKTPPFIATLGMLWVARGLALLYTNGMTITGLPQNFIDIGVEWLGPVPIPVVIAIVIMLIGHIYLRYTRFGLHLFATGGNTEGARLSSVNVQRIKLSTYVISGILAAAGGLVLTARVYSGQPTLADGMELQAVAAVVIGGTPLSGGEGSMLGTILGVAVMGVLTNGLNLMNVSSYWQFVAIGLVIVFAVIMDVRRRKRLTR